jgi:hypothetical protein
MTHSRSKSVRNPPAQPPPGRVLSFLGWQHPRAPPNRIEAFQILRKDLSTACVRFCLR